MVGKPRSGQRMGHHPSHRIIIDAFGSYTLYRIQTRRKGQYEIFTHINTYYRDLRWIRIPHDLNLEWLVTLFCEKCFFYATILKI